MAAKSPINAHPDEMDHIAAGRYFQKHWALPPVGSPESANTYSQWGFSYLDLGDVVYLFFGKAAAIGAYFGAAPALAMRTTQVMFYLVLLLWCLIRARRMTPAMGFLLLTPQVWYIFSYVNGDAFPFLLFTALLVELDRENSGIRVFWRSKEARPTAGTFIAGALLGFLLISKLNYLVGITFLAGTVLWLKKEIIHWKRVVLPLAASAAIAMPWLCQHAWVNHFQTGTRMEAYAEKVAAPGKEPRPLGDPHPFPYIALRSKGIPLSALFTRGNWGERSFYSFSGVYGWVNIPANPWIYQGFGALDAMLLILLMGPTLWDGSRKDRTLLLGLLVFMGLVVTQSICRSWVVNFQAQGRYLFPILPAFLFYWLQCEKDPIQPLTLAVSAMFGALSLISFYFFALARLT